MSPANQLDRRFVWFSACTIACLCSLAAVPAGAATKHRPEATKASKPGRPEVSPAGDIPDNQAFVSYSPKSGGYAVKVPEGWARSTIGPATSFTDKLNTIRMEASIVSTAPTTASAVADELPILKLDEKHVSGAKSTVVVRKAGKAILLAYQRDGMPNAVTGKVVREAVERYEFWRSGTQVSLTLSGPVGADNVDPWRIVSDSFTWR